MADLKENKNQALQELKRLQESDKPHQSALDLLEPELEAFDASSIFEVDEEVQEEEKRPFRLGKHSKKRASRVKVKKNEFENTHMEIEDLPLPGKHASKEEQPVEPVQEEAPVQEETPVSEEPTVTEETVETVEEIVQPEEETVPEAVAEPKENEDNVVEDDDDDDIQVEFYDEDPSEEQAGETEVQGDGSENTEENEETEQEAEMEEAEEYSDEDLVYEKNNFLLSQYDQEVKYLEQQSQKGYHFVRKEGKHYAFVQGEPKDYYYSINYFTEEPTPEMKKAWSKAGWKMVTTASTNKKEAGWYVFRNEEQPGEYRKTIDNEEEKYQFFRRYASSCRSTLFLIFVCMAVCIVAGFLQWSFKGSPIGIAVCGILFVIALIAFISYNRMLKEAKRMSSLLKARLRLKAREDSVMGGYEESDAELDSDWNELNK